MNVNSYDMHAAAKAEAARLVASLPAQYPAPDDEDTVVAVVVERHDMTHQSDGRMTRSEYGTRETFGSTAALTAGGWIK